MCLLAIQYRLVTEAPILVAANRDERYERPTQAPTIQPGKPRVLCGTDLHASGTWLGINQAGLFVAVANRPKTLPTFISRSRGLLCRDLLRASSARQAADTAVEELMTGKYNGANFVVADLESGWAIHGGDEVDVVPLREGLNIISSGDLNDPRDERLQLAQRLLTLQTLDSPVKFLASASKVFSKTANIDGKLGAVMRGAESGTVSSTLVSLGPKPRDAIFQYAPSAPDRSRYEDFSPLLRDILSRGLRESKTRAKA